MKERPDPQVGCVPDSSIGRNPDNRDLVLNGLGKGSMLDKHPKWHQLRMKISFDEQASYPALKIAQIQRSIFASRPNPLLPKLFVDRR